MTTSLKIILDDLADFHQMRRLRRDAQGVYTLVFDGRWVVNIESDPLSGTVSIFGSAGQVRPVLDRSPLLSEVEWQRISDAELPFGGRVGVHFRSGVVMLDSRADPAQLDSVAFRQWLLAFVAQMSLWASRIEPDAVEQTDPARLQPDLARPATRFPANQPR